jgi:isopenicillin-N epimerase
VRREKIDRIWPLMAAPPAMDGNIRKFEEIGTHPAANHNAIAEALSFHEGIGAERKAARLRFLRERWMTRLDGESRVRLFTSRDPAQSCAIGTVGIEGLEPAAIVDHLWKSRRIIVTPIVHAEYRGVRVTPNVYTTLEEVHRCDARCAEERRPSLRSTASAPRCRGRRFECCFMVRPGPLGRGGEFNDRRGR